MHYRHSHKNKERFLKEKERVKVSLSLWLCHLSSKLNLTTVRKNPTNQAVVRLLSCFIVWISDTANMVLLYSQFWIQNGCTCCTNEKICEVNFFSLMNIIISDISDLAIKTPERSFYCLLWTDIPLVLEDQNNSWAATYLNSSE